MFIPPNPVIIYPIITFSSLIALPPSCVLFLTLLASPSNGLSLNNVLHTGPILQSDLTILILRWRLLRFVFTANMQILVVPDHTPFQRILLRQNPQEDVLDIEKNTVTFGVNCAPYLVIRTLYQLAEDCESDLPFASEVLRSQMYLGDILAGSHSLVEATQNRDKIIPVLNSTGFSLRKWSSNDRGLIEDFPPIIYCIPNF